MPQVNRRRFLGLGVAGGGALAFGPGFWHAAYAAPARPGPGPYGPLSDTPDANGLLLPAGFTSRVIAVSGQPVAGTAYPWHSFPDGGTTIPADDGGWFYVGNSEFFAPPGSGGASAIRFGPDGEVVGAHRLLAGTTANCAGGRTPWGTWLSCEEHPRGQVWECDPTTPLSGEARPALGTFAHEAVAVDHDRGRLYLTEDEIIDDETDNLSGEGPAVSGSFYRFTPTSYPDLGAGRLEAASLAADDPTGTVTWVEVDPAAPFGETQPDRQERPDGVAQFSGAEGCWYDSGHIYFTTKTNNRVWDHDIEADTITVLYDAEEHGGEGSAPLYGVDNVIVSRAGDLYVCEDGGNMEVVIVSAEREVAPLLRLPEHPDSITELAGPGFAPAGDRFYFSSRSWGVAGPGTGVTYEVTGPFRGAQASVPTTTTTLGGVGQAPVPSPAPAPGGGTLPATGGAGAGRGLLGVGALAGAAAAWRLRTRRHGRAAEGR